MENVIITTTINTPTFLEGICKNLKRFKYGKNENSIIVIGDLKTPKTTNNFCQKLSSKYGYKINYFDIAFQNSFFKKKYKSLYNFFPLNDAVRKLLGSIYLFKKLPNRVIFIDDDNYVNDQKDFLKGHLVTNSKLKLNSVNSKSKWPNLYKYFKERSNVPFYARGYPWKYRNLLANKFSTKKKLKKVIANCGYILGDPDIDANSRLFWPIETLGVAKEQHFTLDKENFFPLNDQNTSVAKNYIPLYFKPLSGGRNSDIWTSYLIEKVAYAFNETVAYGPPIITQVRNKHDYWKDYELEKEHNISTDLFSEILESIKISKTSNRLDAFINLCDKFVIKINILSKESKKKINLVRHYQAISNKEKLSRRKNSLRYIKMYINEYKKWLVEVRKIFS
tara:strand:+ start:418 stop:1596 length:1179 start_codon:yes stop_codon:yes gene_type:complete